MAIIKGIFTSIWDGGTEVETDGTLDTDTGSIDTEQVDVDVETLDEEYFTDENGKMYEVCPECHEYITKVVVIEGVGKHLTDHKVCTNPDCDNSEYNL
jgi:hypothetical protein